MTKQSITRRDLLKAALAAGGGITADAFLPEKWVKPVMESGVLPMHAYASRLGRLWGTANNEGDRVVFYKSGTTITMKTGLKVAKPISSVSKMGSAQEGDYPTLAGSGGSYSKYLPPDTYSPGSKGNMAGCNSPTEYQLSTGQSIEVSDFFADNNLFQLKY